MPTLDDALWARLLRRPDDSARRRLFDLWTAAGLLGLVALAWAEPFSGRLFAEMIAGGTSPTLVEWGLRPLVMALRGVLLVESFGYAYHRFFQHVGWLTRRSGTIRRNQMYHWLHHMVIYPIGRFYKRDTGYVASEAGLALSWSESPYFHRLEDIHLLHHWDQAKNFTIVHPLMDALFGTYLSPAAHRAEIAAVVSDDALTASDATNWRYLLKEATPAEHAAFISQAKRHPRSIRKVELLLACLERRLALFPADAEALDLHIRAKDLLALVEPEPAAAPGGPAAA